MKEDMLCGEIEDLHKRYQVHCDLLYLINILLLLRTWCQYRFLILLGCA